VLQKKIICNKAINFSAKQMPCKPHRYWLAGHLFCGYFCMYIADFVLILVMISYFIAINKITIYAWCTNILRVKQTIFLKEINKT
jgi:hypothetical protein